MSNASGIGRFPMPTTHWITKQMPAELVPLFGFRDERIPDEYRDEIEYLYTIDYPDGTPYRMSILVEYISDPEEPVVAFVMGDTIELDGASVVVANWESGRVPATSSLGGYTYHQVTVTLPAAEDGDG